MTPCLAAPSGWSLLSRLRLAGLGALVLLGTLAPSFTLAAEPTRKFDVPAGPAEKSLKLFASQAGRGVIFSTDSVKDIRTQAVQGEYSSAAALARMVEGTALVVTPDEKTGAFAVRRGPGPNGERAEQATPRDRPAQINPGDNGSTPSGSRAAAAADSDRTVVLSPFEVTSEKDIGYTAASSAMGGRLNTALEDTAASVSILNEQFLQDLAVTTLTEAAEWAPNAVNLYRDAENPFNDYNVAVRSLGASYQTSKNFFRYYINPDAFFTERIDFGRGPNSLVFGDTGVAGAFNVSSKRARPDARRRIETQFFSTGGYRVGVDLNQPLNERFQVRVIYLKQDSDGWQDFQRTKFEGASATFTWKPFRKTTVWGEYEYGYRRTVQASGVYDLYSAGIAWWETGRRARSITSGARAITPRPRGSVTGSSCATARGDCS